MKYKFVVYTNNVDIFQKYIFNINIYLYFLNYSQVVIIKKYLKKNVKKKINFNNNNNNKNILDIFFIYEK